MARSVAVLLGLAVLTATACRPAPVPVVQGVPHGPGVPAWVEAVGGAVWLSVHDPHAVMRVEADGTVTHVAGAGAAGYSGDGGPATAATLNEPMVPPSTPSSTRRSDWPRSPW